MIKNETNEGELAENDSDNEDLMTEENHSEGKVYGSDGRTLNKQQGKRKTHPVK